MEKIESQVKKEGDTEHQDDDPTLLSVAEGGAASSAPEKVFIPTGTNEISSRLAIKWGYIGQVPKIDALFERINHCFFRDLLPSLYVRFSRKLINSVGYTNFNDHEDMYQIILSYPILILRPHSEIVNTLIHEAIHAYNCLFDAYIELDNHGSTFQRQRVRISKAAGMEIDETDNFHSKDQKRHNLWRCSGPCKTWPPYFGVARMKPGAAPESDEEHVAKCGGSFTMRKKDGPAVEEMDMKDVSHTEVDCFLCGKTVLKAELIDHLDACVESGYGKADELCFVPADTDEEISESSSLEEVDEEQGAVYICPHCSTQLLWEQMCEHLDHEFSWDES